MKIYVKASESSLFSNPLRDYFEEIFFPKFKQAFKSAFDVSPNSYDWVPAGMRSTDFNISFSNIRLKYIVIKLAKRDWNKDKVPDYDKFDKLRIQQGWDNSIWNVNVPYDLIYSPDLVNIIVNELNTLTSFKKYLVPETEAKSKSSWPSARKWYGVDTDDTEFNDMWDIWLATPEETINSELQIFPEPSVQGNAGGMFIHDESGEERTENGYPWYEDWQDWCNWQIAAAASSKNASEYQKKYREHIKELCGI